MRGWKASAQALVFPPQCILCGALVAERGGLCGPCWRDTPILLGAVCPLCNAPVLSEGAASEGLCNACHATGRPWDWGRAVMLYTGGARRLVLGLKHGDRLDLVPPLASWMAARAAARIAPDALFAPVPIHRWRLFRRRYNQAALLANAVGHALAADTCPDLLDRVRPTPPQRGSDSAARHANVAGAIRVAPRHASKLAGRAVVIVDDVMTSGATLAACAVACRQAGAREVGILVLARAARDDYIAGQATRDPRDDAFG